MKWVNFRSCSWEWQNRYLLNRDFAAFSRTIHAFGSSEHVEKVPMQYDYERLLKELGVRVRKLRLERRWTHRQMIAEHGFHLNQLHKIEKGEPVSTQTLLRLCAAFDLKLSELVEGLAEGE